MNDREIIARVLRKNQGLNPQLDDDAIVDQMYELGDGDGI